MMLTLVLCSTLLAVCSAAPQAASNKPHLVYLLVDDWGWANVGYHRDPPTTEVVTPNFDSLKNNGLELDQFYVYQFCSPSRSSLMTGRLPVHVNVINPPPGVYNPKDTMSGFGGIPRAMTGLAEKMREAGYATHQVGKWHAGMATPESLPTGRGFQTSLGYLSAFNDFYTELLGQCTYNKTVVHPVDLWDTDKPAIGVNGTGEDLFKQRLIEVLNNHDPSTPLFLYYAPHIVHAPLQVPDSYLQQFSFIKDSDRQYYHAMVKYLDDIVGVLVDMLKQKGMWDNLLLVVTSDNGGPEYPGGGANNYPLRGGKLTDWQGGIRVNAFVSGGFLPEKMRGQKTEGYIHIADWYGTFCGLAGVDPTDKKAAAANLPPVDSLDVWPLISGQNSTSPRTDIHVSTQTLISGDYKLLTGKQQMAGWTGPQYPNQTNPHGGIKAVADCGHTGCLFNIKDDPEERRDLASTMPGTLKMMLDKLAEYNKTYFNPNRGNEWPGACDVVVNKYQGFWGPFLT